MVLDATLIMLHTLYCFPPMEPLSPKWQVFSTCPEFPKFPDPLYVRLIGNSYDWGQVVFTLLLLSVPEEMQPPGLFSRVLFSGFTRRSSGWKLLFKGLHCLVWLFVWMSALIPSLTSIFLGFFGHYVFGNVIAAWMRLPLTLQRANTHAE